jgi:hypothetical protein
MATGQRLPALIKLRLGLLWMIYESPRTADTACLALCSHHLLSSLARRVFLNLLIGRTRTLSDDARVELQSRLSNGLPQYYLWLYLWQKTELSTSSTQEKTISKHDTQILNYSPRKLLEICRHVDGRNNLYHWAILLWRIFETPKSPREVWKMRYLIEVRDANRE